MSNHVAEQLDLKELDVLNPASSIAPATILAKWAKKPFVKNMWEMNLRLEDESELAVSVYGIVWEASIESDRLIDTALCVQETLHLWRESIIEQVMQLSREWGRISEETLRETLKLAHVQFDSEQVLSAIYFQTPCLSGHQVVVEFDGDGNPYEAEITG